jgi:1,4-dihydroxy-2-naphthoate polyprenyltransferase
MTSYVFKAWYQASRAKFFIATLIPLALGGVIAWRDGFWNTQLWLIILAASFLVHLNTNLANDYFEYFSGADDGDSIGGSRVLQDGSITLDQMRTVMITFYVVALICGLLILNITHLWWLIAVMMFSFFSSLFYTAPPIRYGYRGMGELFVGLNMGPVMVAGTAAVLSGRLPIQAVWLSIPIAFMVAYILYYQSLSDIYEDKAVGKITLAVRLGRTNIIHGFRLFAAASLLSVIILVITKQLHPIGLVSLLTVGLLFKLDKLIRTIKNIQELHDRGKPVRMFYLLNGLILIFTSVFTKQ